MRKEYRNELRELTEKMVLAEDFAKKVPMFSEKILAEKLTGEENWKQYISFYKKLGTFNGVSRGFFKTDTSRIMTNNNEYHEGYYWTLYINTLCEYNSHANYGLKEIHKEVPVFFFDNLNSTFYCTDEQIEKLLEALNIWVIKAKDQNRIDRVDEEIKNAEKELETAMGKVQKLKDLNL
ncbi:hypothetical protein KAR91_13035 [Candidatus Pacearchaeota archaeon]|nr:hypothetical protein [Candidatus Pacearchaeota archaeon]